MKLRATITFDSGDFEGFVPSAEWAREVECLVVALKGKFENVEYDIKVRRERTPRKRKETP